MRSTGKIIRWNEDQGYGFVHGDDGSSDVFIHIKEFENRSRTPAIGDNISYKINLDDQIRIQAVSIRYVKDGLLSCFRKFKIRTVITAFIVSFYAFVITLLVLYRKLPVYGAFGIFLLSIISYLFYRADKMAAEHGRWRTSENTLHILSLLGGWPGALVAQVHLRHKSSKLRFKVVFYFTVMMNITAISYLSLTEDGMALQSDLYRLLWILN